ncbi:OmpA/MotB family protein [Galenea microaerophila]
MPGKIGRKREEQAESSAWEIAFADLMTTLMVFFLVMWLTSIIDPSKRQQFVDALSGQTVAKNSAGNNVVMDKSASNQEGTIKPIETKPPISPEEIKQIMKKIDPKAIKIEETEDYTKITLRSDSFFESGRATINDNILEQLEKLGESLAGRNQKIYITGYTDSVPIHNLQFPSNWELSAARAASVARTFIYMGVDKALLTILGRADNDPIAPNSTAYGRSLNRRVEIVLEKPHAQQPMSNMPSEIQKLIPPDKRE